MPIAKLDGAELAAAVGREAAPEHVAHLHDRHVVALGQDHLGAVLQRRALQRRELERPGRSSVIGTPLLRSTVAGDGRELRIGRRQLERRRRAGAAPRQIACASPGLTTQRVVALARASRLPAACTWSAVAAVSMRLQAVAEAARVAGVDRAFGERVGLAAEAADALDAADEAGLEHGARLLELGRGRAFGEQRLQFLVDRLLDLRRVDALLDVGR